MKKIALLSVLIAGTAMACPSGTRDLGVIQAKPACELSGTYVSDVTLTSDTLWVLRSAVYIGQDNKISTKLTIQPGTKIVGQSGSDFLVINRGSKILANGTKENPIVFTSAKTTGRKRADWGGLIINGNAPINDCASGSAACEAEGEGATGKYGGNNPHDNSGVLRFVRVEWAGFQITPTNELNGIAFQGVGDGTTVDYVQVHMCADDGVEFFGGTVNVKHLVITGNDDDGFDWTSGFSGKAQYVLIKQPADTGNNGIEADNLEARHTALPRSNPNLSNFTIIGSKTSPTGGYGILLRRGTAATIANTIVTNMKNAQFDMDDAETFRIAKDESLINVTSSVLAPVKTYALKATDPWDYSAWLNSLFGNIIADPKLVNFTPDTAKLVGYIPAADSVAVGAGLTPDDLFFDEVDFIGAVRSEQEDWTKGWTVDDLN